MYGHATDEPDMLVKTIVVVMGNCDFIVPKFVAEMKPMHHLNAQYLQHVVPEVIQKSKNGGAHVSSLTLLLTETQSTQRWVVVYHKLLA